MNSQQDLSVAACAASQRTDEIKQDSDGRKLIGDFFSERDSEKAFWALDALCNWVIKQPIAAAQLSSSLVSSLKPLQERVLEIDAWGERYFGVKILNNGNGTDYPWILDDYYSAEAQFISDAFGCNPPARIIQLGHGAIPRLAIALHSIWPHAEFTLVDRIDEQQQIAAGILSIFAPRLRYHHISADVSDLFCRQRVTTDFDLAIVSNAVLSNVRFSTLQLPSDAVFIRSASAAGSLLYPRAIERGRFLPAGFSLVREKVCPIYGIHEWLFFKGPGPVR